MKEHTEHEKRLLIGSAIFAMVVFSVSGCGSKKTSITQPTQSIESTQRIEINQNVEKPQSTAAAQNIEADVHELDDECICKTCGSEILDFGDIDVSEYDANGNVIRK